MRHRSPILALALPLLASLALSACGASAVRIQATAIEASAPFGALFLCPRRAIVAHRIALTRRTLIRMS